VPHPPPEPGLHPAPAGEQRPRGWRRAGPFPRVPLGCSQRLGAGRRPWARCSPA